MRPRRGRVALVAVALLPLAGCGNPPASPRASTAAAATPAAPATAPPMTAALNPAAAGANPTTSAVSPTPAAVAEAATATDAADRLTYEVKGRRDPFAPLEVLEGVKAASVSTAKLRGIVSGSNGPLALIDTAEGVGYIMKRGDTLVDGRLVDIKPDSVVFAVAPKPGSAAAPNRITLRLPQD
jgi:Tfp pilus assembly protein PilP